MATMKRTWQSYKDNCIVCPWGVARLGRAVKQNREQGKVLAKNAILAFPLFSWMKYPRIAINTYKWSKRVVNTAKRQ
jgi:hypothetical protein